MVLTYTCMYRNIYSTSQFFSSFLYKLNIMDRWSKINGMTMMNVP